ncbi:MAG: hypothetical protein Q9175_000308 [Cornicularia normoerica]
MDDTRNVTQYCQEDIDEEVGIATALEKDTKGREDDGEDDLADVATVKETLVMITMYSSTKIQVKHEENEADESEMTVVAIADERARDLPCSERHDE